MHPLWLFSYTSKDTPPVAKAMPCKDRELTLAGMALEAAVGQHLCEPTRLSHFQFCSFFQQVQLNFIAITRWKENLQQWEGDKMALGGTFQGSEQPWQPSLNTYMKCAATLPGSVYKTFLPHKELVYVHHSTFRNTHVNFKTLSCWPQVLPMDTGL